MRKSSMFLFGASLLGLGLMATPVRADQLPGNAAARA